MSDLNSLQRKILYKATHRSNREADILFGEFVKKNINFFSEEELFLLEKVVEYEDPIILQAIRETGVIKDLDLRALFKKVSLPYGRKYSSYV